MLDACVAVQMTHLYFLILVLMVKNEAAADPAGPFGTHNHYSSLGFSTSITRFEIIALGLAHGIPES